MVAFTNSNIYLDGKKVVKANLSVVNGKFKMVKSPNAIKLDSKYIIVPGFIEEHMHGANGSDVMDGTIESLHNIASSITRDGVTSFLPTTMTESKDSIIRALINVANKKQEKDEAKILGVHLEGPFIASEFKGAQNPKHILKPSVKDMRDFIKASNNKVRLVTVAIEEAEPEFLRYLKKNHITISAGHSNAKEADFSKYLKLGLINSTTHTYNAMSRLHHRDLGLTGMAMLHDEIYGELILDLHHTSANAARLMLKCKGKDHLIVITDSCEARYKKKGTFKIGATPIMVVDGVAKLMDGVTFAASVLELSKGLKNAKAIFNDLSFEEIIDLVTKNVANNLHLDNVGVIKNGNDADFVIVDKNFNVYQTYVNGKLVYSKKNFKL